MRLNYNVKVKTLDNRTFSGTVVHHADQTLLEFMNNDATFIELEIDHIKEGSIILNKRQIYSISEVSE